MTATVTTDTRTLPAIIECQFHGHPLHLVEYKSEPYVIMKPLIAAMGLAWVPQYVKLTADRARWSITNIIIDPVGSKTYVGEREAMVMPLRKLPAFTFTISAKKVAPHLRQQLRAFQTECDEALWRYWNDGVAVRKPALDQGSALRIAELEQEITGLREAQERELTQLRGRVADLERSHHYLIGDVLLRIPLYAQIKGALEHDVPKETLWRSLRRTKAEIEQTIHRMILGGVLPTKLWSGAWGGMTMDQAGRWASDLAAVRKLAEAEAEANAEPPPVKMPTHGGGHA